MKCEKITQRQRLIDLETKEFIIRPSNNDTNDYESDFSDCPHDQDDTLDGTESAA